MNPGSTVGYGCCRCIREVIEAAGSNMEVIWPLRRSFCNITAANGERPQSGLCPGCAQDHRRYNLTGEVSSSRFTVGYGHCRHFHKGIEVAGSGAVVAWPPHCNVCGIPAASGERPRSGLCPGCAQDHRRSRQWPRQSRRVSRSHGRT